MDTVDEDRAVLVVDEATYEQFFRNANPALVHRWAEYCAFVEKRIQKGRDSGLLVKEYQATAEGISAFLFVSKREFDTSTLCAYAAHLFRAEQRKG